MTNTSTSSSITELFGEVIHAYTRANMIDDGFLVDVTEVAHEANFRCPVALTRALWEDSVAWEEADTKRQTYQDQEGRLWDVVYMGFLAFRSAIKKAQEGQMLIVPYEYYRVPRGGTGMKPRRTQAKIIAGPGDHGELVITIMLPEEN